MVMIHLPCKSMDMMRMTMKKRTYFELDSKDIKLIMTVLKDYKHVSLANIIITTFVTFSSSA